MGKSEAWDEIMPTIRESNAKNNHTSRYLALPDNIVDLLIDAAEPYFMGKWYKIADVEKFCKDYLRKNHYTFIGSETIIEKVASYFHENRTHIADAREIYPELVAEILPTWEELKYLPGGICNKVRYILALEHYRSHKESMAPWENQE